MIEEKQNTQPTQDPQDILKRLDELTTEVRTLRKAVEDVQTKYKTETQVTAMIETAIAKNLDGYSTTKQVRQILTDTIAGINRGMGDGFRDLNDKIDKFVNSINEKTTRHESELNHNSEAIALMQQRQEGIERTVTLITSAQEAQKTLLGRIDENIRGNGEKNGLTARVATVEDALPRIENVLTELATIAKTNQAMVLADREKAEKEEVARQARRDKYERYAIKVIQGTITALITSGGLGTLFLIIGQALTQQ